MDTFIESIKITLTFSKVKRHFQINPCWPDKQHPHFWELAMMSALRSTQTCFVTHDIIHIGCFNNAISQTQLCFDDRSFIHQKCTSLLINNVKLVLNADCNVGCYNGNQYKGDSMLTTN